MLVTGDQHERLAPDAWRPADWRSLLAETGLAPTRARTHAEVAVLAPPPLSRWVLGRALALGLDVRLASAERRPLGADGPVAGVVWLRAFGDTEKAPVVVVRGGAWRVAAAAVVPAGV